jgi:CRISPR-associated protein (TIGR03984 family)
VTLSAKVETWTGSIDALLAWIRGGATPVEVPGRWLLAHCDGGVVWGLRGDDDRWTLSGDVFPEMARPLDGASVQQLRVFGEAGELLVWRHEGTLRARWLADRDTDVPECAKPDDEEDRLLLGRKVERTSRGFTLLNDGTGARHAPPVTGPFHEGQRPRLRVRHYFEHDEETGAVRVAASRLVAVEEG